MHANTVRFRVLAALLLASLVVAAPQPVAPSSVKQVTSLVGNATAAVSDFFRKPIASAASSAGNAVGQATAAVGDLLLPPFRTAGTSVPKEDLQLGGSNNAAGIQELIDNTSPVPIALTIAPASSAVTSSVPQAENPSRGLLASPIPFSSDAYMTPSDAYMTPSEGLMTPSEGFMTPSPDMMVSESPEPVAQSPDFVFASPDPGLGPVETAPAITVEVSSAPSADFFKVTESPTVIPVPAMSRLPATVPPSSGAMPSSTSLTGPVVVDPGQAIDKGSAQIGSSTPTADPTVTMEPTGFGTPSTAPTETDVSTKIPPVIPRRPVVAKTSPARPVVTTASPARTVVTTTSPARSVVTTASPARPVVTETFHARPVMPPATPARPGKPMVCPCPCTCGTEIALPPRVYPKPATGRLSTSKRAACVAAFNHCQFTLGNAQTLPTFLLPATADMPFTGNITLKSGTLRVGTADTGPFVPEFIGAGGAYNITQFGSPPLAQTAFQFYPLPGTDSAVGHQHLRGNQAEIIQGHCVRLWLSSYQLIGSAGSITPVTLGMPTPRRCVVFTT